MTDREKIREEVERLKEWQSIATPSLNKLLSLLDTMQEEPVSVWNDASKKYPFAVKEIIVLRDNKIYYGKYIGGFHRYVRAEIQLTYDTAQTYAIIDYLTEKDKWIYVEDLLKLSNVQITVKDRKEPVSGELEEAANAYISNENNYSQTRTDTFKAGAEWQKEQFEKNRLKHCNSITNEQAELEQGFIDQHLDKYRRMPTFLDAIEYGMRLQKAQMKEALRTEYEKGRHDALEGIPRWKPAARAYLGDRLPRIDRSLDRLVARIGESEIAYYLKIEDLYKLPKEE